MNYNSFMMGGFNKNPNDQTTNPNMIQPNSQQNPASQAFMGNLQNNAMMNFSMPGPQINPGSFEGSENFTYGSMGQSSVYQEHLKKLKDKFGDLKEEILKMDKNPELFKNHQLPLARVKKIMKSDEDVRMISAEAPVLFAKACEIFIVELTHRAWYHTEESKRRTLQKIDIANCISHTDIFDFLLDIIPKEEYKATQPPRKSNEALANAFQQLSSGTNSNLMMGNKNVNQNSNFNPLMGQNFLNMGNLLGQNNPQNQNPNQQQNNSSSPYPGFANFMNPNNLQYVGIKEENKNNTVNNQSQQKMNNNNK